MFAKKMPEAFWIGDTYVCPSKARDSFLYVSWGGTDSGDHAYLRSNNRRLRRAVANARRAGTYREA